jgi:phage-related protein (TIGR01555 family)
METTERRRLKVADSPWYAPLSDIPPTHEAIRARYAPPATLASPRVLNPDGNLAMDAIPHGFDSILSHVAHNGITLSDVAPQFLGYAYLAGLAQNPIIRAGVTTVADDMTKEFIRIAGASDDDDRVKAIDAALTKFKIKDRFNEAAQMADFYGGCLLFIDTGETDLEIPLAMDTAFLRGKIKGFTLVDPINVAPGLYNSTDPLRDDYFRPSQWRVLGRAVHASRFLRFVPNDVPTLFKPAYNFFGIPIAQQALDYVAHFTKTREAAQRLLTKFSLTVFKTQTGGLFFGGKDNGEVQKRLRYLAQFRDNDSVLVIDTEEEDVVKLETPISGTTDVVRQALEFVAAVFRIPFVKFLGISPGGLNATGESDLRNYYDHVLSKQEKMFRKPMDRLLEIIQAHLFGAIDPDIHAEFIPINDEDDAKRSATQKTKADRDAIYIDRGVLSPEEVREALASDPESDYAFINPAALPETEETDPLAGGFPEGMMPGQEAPLDDTDRAGEVAADAASEEKWATINGTPVRIDKDGNPQGDVGEKIRASGENPENNTGRSRSRAPISELSGNELGVKDGESLQDAAKRYYETLTNNPANREGFGEVRFYKGSGWKKLESASLPDPERLKLLPSVKPIIEHGDYIGRSDSNKQRKDGIVAFHYFEGNVKIGDETKFVGVSVGEDSRGNKFYNLNQDPDVLLKKSQANKKTADLAEDMALSGGLEARESAEEIARGLAPWDSASEALNLIIL